MENTIKLLYAIRPWHLMPADGHAMPFGLVNLNTLGDFGIHILADVTSVAQGISVPISRGGPPIFR